MRKFTFFLSMLFAMTVMAQTGGYEVNYTGMKNSDRTLNYIKVESASYASSSYYLTFTEKVQLFVDATETVTLKVGAGDIVTPSVGFSGSWMHAYVYVDANGDGTFTAGVAEDGYTPTGDLVAYSFYGTNENNGYNSAGTPISGDGRNTVALPTFKAPEATGTYRMRFKIDWNSIDPAGCNDASNTLKANRGAIIDVNLEVAEAQEGIAEQLFNATTITDGQFAKGTAWYTLQLGANGFVIADNGTADHIALSEYMSDATDNAQLWAFVGDNTNGYKLYNKNTGTAKVLAAPTTMNGATGSASYPVLVDATAVPAGYTDMWMFTSSADLGEGDTYFYMYEKGYPANKVNNRDNKLAFWNGGADAGSTLNIQLGQVEYPVSTKTGEWTASNAAGTWAAGWKSATAPHALLQETQGRNNIAGYNAEGDLQLYTCLANATVNGVFIATYSVSSDDNDYMVAGYNFDFVSSGTNDVTVTPNGGEAVTANSATAANVSVVNSEESAQLTFDVTSTSNMFANTSNFYITLVRKAPAVEPSQDIFVTNKGGIPYRIPAIAMAKNGDLIAVADYRHSGSDIGVVNNGRIDLHARISKDNGATWEQKFAIVEGKGSSSPDFMHVGFGDPCIVADRESDRVLVLSCAGNVSFQAGTRNNHQNIARFYSEDNGATWSEPVDIAEAIYSMWDNSSNHGQAKAMFVGSGKIHQSRYVKVNNYYRLYCSVLLRNRNNAYTNFVLYSDDFGGSWKVLGGVENAPISSGGDEPKVEELPNGNVVISSRINGGRFFNIFTFTDMEAATGSWGSVARSDSSNNGVVALGNSTNGEIMIMPAVRNEDGEKVWIALQSLPFGSGRTNVGIYYKELASELDYNTPANFAKDWDGRHQATFIGSAYSTMCFQKDSTIAFLYEESTYGADYTIVYKNYTLEQITDGAYSISSDTTLPEPDETESEETKALIADAKELLANEGIGTPTGSARAALEAAVAAAEAKPTAAAGTALSIAIDSYYSATEIVVPEAGKTYTFTAVWGDAEYYIYNNNGTLAVAARNGDVPAEGQFVCEYNADEEYKFQFKTSDGAYYLAYPTIGGKNWLDNESLTGLEATSSKVTKFNVNKILSGGSVSATNEALFGLVRMDGWRGYDNGKYTDSYGPIVVKHSAQTFDGASDAYYNENFTSAFRVEEVEQPEEVVEPLEVVSITPANGETVEKLEQVVVTFSAPVTLDETKNISLVAVEEKADVTPIEAYAGKWEVASGWPGFPEYNYSEIGTIEVIDYDGAPALRCTGFSGYTFLGYDDSFLMMYNSEDGTVTLESQQLGYFNDGDQTSETILVCGNTEEGVVFTGSLIGRIENGNIVFESAADNRYVADSWMFYAPDIENGVGISYYNSLVWTPAAQAAAPAKAAARSRIEVKSMKNIDIAPIAKSKVNRADENVVSIVSASINPDDETQLIIKVNEALANGTYKLSIEAGAVVTAEGATNEAIICTYYLNDPTGVEEVKAEDGKVKAIYDLQGRKVTEPVKGIYIINGKKIFVK